MISKSRAAGIFLVLGAALSLGACDSTIPITCPDVGVIKDAAQFVDFRPGTGRDATDVVAKAEMTAARLECAFAEDVVETKVTFALTVTRGPAMTGDQVTLPYFVAVVSADETKLVSKRQFELTVPMGGQQTVRLIQEIPADATLVPRPSGLMQPKSSVGGGSVGGPNGTQKFNVTGPSLYAGERGGSGEKPARRPGVILPGVQGAIPYQVLVGFQLTKDQLTYNRDQIRP
jgi:hypothetical protein